MPLGLNLGDWLDEILSTVHESRLVNRFVFFIFFAFALMPIAFVTGDWVGVLLWLALVAWCVFGGVNEVAVVSLASYPFLLLYARYGVFSTNPIGSVLYMLVVVLPSLIMLGYWVKLLRDVSAKSASMTMAIGAWYALAVNPYLALAYAVASTFIGLVEAYPSTWIPLTSVAVAGVLSALFTGSPAVAVEPIRLWTTGEPLVTHPLPTAFLATLAVSVIMGVVALVAVRRFSERGAELTASAVSVLPTLVFAPYAVATWIAVGAFALLANYSRLELIRELYGDMVEVPTRGELIKLLNENWNQLIGLDEAKEELIQASESFTGRGNVRPIHGILLYGPAGTGKTALGLGYSAWLGLYRGFTVIIVKTGELMRGGPWWTAWRLEQVFKLARSRIAQPSVIYIDEVDSIGLRRNPRDKASYRLVSVLLQNIDGVVSRFDKVLVVATTNNVDALDEALIRPGRLGDLKIYVGKPEPELVKKIITGLARQRGVDVPPQLLEDASRVIETGAEAEAFINCLAIKGNSASLKQRYACLAGVTKGLRAYAPYMREYEPPEDA